MGFSFRQDEQDEQDKKTTAYSLIVRRIAVFFGSRIPPVNPVHPVKKFCLVKTHTCKAQQGECFFTRLPALCLQNLADLAPF